MHRVCIFILIVLLMLLSNLNSFGQSTKWAIKDPEMVTKWSKQVSIDKIPLNEYPRPQMKRPDWISLNGLWDCSVTSLSAKEPNFFDSSILVPFPLESALSGVKRALMPYEALWYRRYLDLKSLKKGEHLLLNFGAVDWKAQVYINGKFVGEHIGGYTAFTCDITKEVIIGRNVLTVRVEDPTDRGYGPHGKQVLSPGNIYYTACSGIWQSVWLEKVARKYVSRISIVPDLDSQLVKIKVFASANDTAHIHIKSNGKVIAFKKGITANDFVIPIKDAHFWSPKDPFLYDVSITLLSDGQPIDSVESYFGIRKISIEKDSNGINRIFLNNKYLYNLGILDQGYWPDGIYTAPTDEALQSDIEFTKLLGFNTIRKHIKIEPARWYYHADRIGMLVWQDFVNPNQSLPLGSRQAFEEQLKETISQLKNSPSIVTWVIFNEKWGQYDQERITRTVKESDPTRLVNGHSGELLYVDDKLRSLSPNAYVNSDMADVHSYPYPRIPPSLEKGVQVVGEFGGFALAVKGHVWDDTKGGWGYNGLNNKTRLYQEYKISIDSLVKLERQGVSGSIYTQPFDVETELNGLMTYDRAILKLSLDSLRKLHRQLIDIVEQKEVGQFGFKEYHEDTTTAHQLLAQIQNRVNDSAFLRMMALTLIESGDSVNSREVCKLYLKAIHNPLAVVNIRFLAHTISSTSDTSLNFICRHFKELELSSDGKNAISQAWSWIEYDIYVMGIDRPNFMTDKTKNDSIIARFGIIAELPILRQEALRALMVKDMSTFVKAKNEIHRKYPEYITIDNMNGDAWAVFLRSMNQNELESALVWSRKVIEKAKMDEFYDTYANILYKLGRRTEAISYQTEAIKLASRKGAREEMKETLEKMKQGLPTWNVTASDSN